MQTEHLTSCKSLDLRLPILSPRSRLYSLKPIGIGTALVEGLTGYITRLAEAHHISVAMLFGYELAPLAGKEYLYRASKRNKYPCRLLASAFRPLARAINGVGLGASEWVDILQRLTFRTDLQFLTLLPWSPVLSRSQLLRPTRAWCSVCYEEWRVQGKTIYDPLLWALRAVSICTEHQIPLRSICVNCGKSLHLIDSRSRPGYCSMCRIWLGKPFGITTLLNKEFSREEIKLMIWAANAIGELLASSPALPTPPKRESISYSLSQIIVKNIGNLSTLSALLHVDKNTIWKWYKGKYMPQLTSLLQLCYLIGMSITDVVHGRITEEHLVSVASSFRKKDAKAKIPKRNRRMLDKAETKNILHKALEEYPPLSLQTVATRLGRNANTLRYWFSPLCKTISLRYLHYRKVQSLKVWKQIKGTLYEVIRNGVSPLSMAQLAKHLSYHVTTLKKRFPQLCRKISESHKRYHESQRASVQKLLQAALTANPPESVIRIARRLKISKSSLYKYFPTLCHQLANHHIKYRQRNFTPKGW
jgi:DNA-binding XRE family transcriptional regulator